MIPHGDLDALMNIDPSSQIPERIVPGRTDSAETADHMARYGFAATHARGDTLDLGSGVGYGAAILATSKALGTLIAFDISSSALAFGKGAYGKPISFVAGDARALPFCDDSFDSIVCLEAIEHVPDPDRVLREIARVLRLEGSLVISTPNKWATSPLARRPINPHHLREWYPRSFRRLVERHFEVEEVLGQSWHSVGSIWRGMRFRIRRRVKVTLRALGVLGIAQRMLSLGRGRLVQESAAENTVDIDLPTQEAVRSSWPQSWKGMRRRGIHVSVILVAKPIRGSIRP